VTVVRVYTKDRCQQCTLTKRLLDRLDVQYVEEDATDERNLEAFKALGFLSAPVVVVGESGDDMWAGFQPDRIKEVAERLKEQA